MMWCPNCQQDVPHVASRDDGGKFCCARCRGALSSDAPVDDEAHEVNDVLSAEDDETSSSIEPIVASHRPPVDLDDWQFDEDLQSIERVMSSLRSSGVFPSESDSTALTIDEAHSNIPNAHMRAEIQNQQSSTGNHDERRKPKSSFLAWTLLSFGLMTFACGGVLLGWSFVEVRNELWTLGMPLTLGGQALLLVGLLFQLEGLWQSNRETTTTLDELDEQLTDLKHQTTILSTTHSDPARSFYAHMAEGASPQLLLSDLKGQLDLLAVKISDTRR